MALQQLDRNPYFTLAGKLDGITHQIVQNLLQPQLIPKQAVRDISSHLRHQHNSLCLYPCLLGSDHLRNATVQTERRTLKLKFARLDLGDIQHVIDQRQQGLGIIFNICKILGLLLRQHRKAEQLGIADHPAHGGADLMAHIGQELGLGIVGSFSLSLGLQQFLPGTPLLLKALFQ